MNHKRVQRLWREEGLRRPVRTRKRRRTRTEDSQRLRAVHPNQVWAIDFQFDSTNDGRQLKSLHVVDEHTREALAMRVGRSCTADEVVDDHHRTGRPTRGARARADGQRPGDDRLGDP